MEIKLEIVGKEVIKAAPNSLFPHDHIQLSLLDSNVPPSYALMIFFYKTEELAEIISQKLKNSLSETLSLFYPLAGRIEGVSIKCTNEGAVFTEAHTDLLLSTYLKNLDINSLHEFFPKIASDESLGAWPLLSIQASFFGSGSGVALAVCASHQICDATSVSTFVRAWAATAKGESNDDICTPQFAGATIFPPAQEILPLTTFDGLKSKGKCVTNRFVFESSKITELKQKAASERVPMPTRVEVISSLIWKSVTKASSTSNLVAPNSSAMIQSMDLRSKIPSTILSKNSIGNLLTMFLVKRDSITKFEICEIVAEFRKAKEELNKMIEENLEDKNITGFGMKLMERFAVIMSGFNVNSDVFPMNSWCRKGFYEADFGWGCPSWVSSGNYMISVDQVYAMLMDTNDGEGIEAWISLVEQDMLALIHDQEFLSYASLNPPVLI